MSRRSRGPGPLHPCAPVAQLDRAPDYEFGGRRFESFRARHFPCRPSPRCRSGRAIVQTLLDADPPSCWPAPHQRTLSACASHGRALSVAPAANRGNDRSTGCGRAADEPIGRSARRSRAGSRNWSREARAGERGVRIRGERGRAARRSGRRAAERRLGRRAGGAVRGRGGTRSNGDWRSGTSTLSAPMRSRRRAELRPTTLRQLKAREPRWVRWTSGRRTGSRRSRRGLGSN